MVPYGWFEVKCKGLLFKMPPEGGQEPMELALIIVLVLIVLGAALSPREEIVLWTFTCPDCLRQATFISREQAEECKRQHKCDRAGQKNN